MRFIHPTGRHLGRKSDGAPGAETPWRGLQKLDFGVRMWRLVYPHSQEPPAWVEYPDGYHPPSLQWCSRRIPADSRYKWTMNLHFAVDRVVGAGLPAIATVESRASPLLRGSRGFTLRVSVIEGATMFMGPHRRS